MKNWLVGIFALALVGCGASQRGVVHNDISITVDTGPGDDLPFDARGARLQAATEQLARLTGRPVAIHVDAAVASALRPQFERELIEAIESMARSLAALQRDDADAFSRTGKALRRVEVRYRAAITEPNATFDPREGVLRVEHTAHPAALVPGGLVYDALADADDAFRERQFGDVMPDAIPAERRRAYFTYVTRTRPGYGALFVHAWDERARAREGNARAVDGGRSAALIRVLRLAELVQGTAPELEAEIRAWLFEQVGFIHDLYRRRVREFSALPENAPLRIAEAAYARWLARAAEVANHRELLSLSHVLYDSEWDRAWPGVDRFGLGLRVIDGWRRDGRPTAVDPKDPRTQVYDDVICPTVRDRSGRRERSRSCFSRSAGYYSWLLGAPEQSARFATALDERDDAALAGSFFAAIAGSHARIRGGGDHDDGYLEILRRLNAEKASFRAGIEVLATTHDAHLDDQGTALWKAFPTRRGDALYLLALAKRTAEPTYADRYWLGFERSFGAPIDAVTFAQMLDHGPTAFALVPGMWSALGPRSSRMDVLIARADASLGDVAQPEAAGSVRALSQIIGRLCQEPNAGGELAKLHAYLSRRMTARPGDAQVLTIAARDTAPGGCKARAKHDKDE